MLHTVQYKVMPYLSGTGFQPYRSFIFLNQRYTLNLIFEDEGMGILCKEHITSPAQWQHRIAFGDMLLYLFAIFCRTDHGKEWCMSRHPEGVQAL
ncbi:hypothetical protein D3C86_1744530 [compost metagenome]